jgi:hypothetical protein
MLKFSVALKDFAKAESERMYTVSCRRAIRRGTIRNGGRLSAAPSKFSDGDVLGKRLVFDLTEGENDFLSGFEGSV